MFLQGLGGQGWGTLGNGLGSSPAGGLEACSSAGEGAAVATAADSDSATRRDSEHALYRCQAPCKVPRRSVCELW